MWLINHTTTTCPWVLHAIKCTALNPLIFHSTTNTDLNSGCAVSLGRPYILSVTVKVNDMGDTGPPFLTLISSPSFFFFCPPCLLALPLLTLLSSFSIPPTLPPQFLISFPIPQHTLHHSLNHIYPHLLHMNIYFSFFFPHCHPF